MSVQATVTTQPISATVSAGGGSVSASVPQATGIAASVSGGVGPQGIQGPVGPASSNTLAALTDVQIDAAAAGDLLRYSNGKWRDYSEQILIDGGNY